MNESDSKTQREEREVMLEKLRENRAKYARRYSEEEKRRAMRAHLIDGLSVPKAAALIGASPTSLRSWLYEFRDSEEGK